ncbi:Peroxin/Dysferlin domain-containing protein [Halteromyces radiatus]|uniref:Peroxin/Dysferlin domain-containing protein n=1 Tax=Halteromyces radiatus TaxID=101107 RepID=UPI0022202487|nr:Peroxin/Dysferlin domain-containing protein [Halteromyces radiatus]KAI8093095.1 Peroxin/Dysferlin domain-containing protein [Halteromyces radiatus]
MPLTNQEKSMAVPNHDTGFSSPYSVYTLENIPPPILKLLLSLGPLLNLIRQAIDIIQWQSSSPRQSILALLIWNSICLWTWTFLGLGIPTLVIVKLAGDWLRVRTLRTRRDRLERARLDQLEKQMLKHQDNDHDDDERLLSQRLQQQREAEEEELISRKIQPQGQVSLDDTLQNIMVINLFVDRLLGDVNHFIYNYLDGSRPEILVAVLGALIYLIPAWFLLVFFLDSHGIFALVGSLALLRYSPWFNVILSAVARHTVLRYVVSVFWAYAVAFITSWRAFDFLGMLTPTKPSLSPRTNPFKQWFSYVRKRVGKEKSSMLTTLQEQRDKDDQQNKKITKNEMVFQFEVYENQRWWLGANWTTNMLSNERGPWTDSQLVSITSKEEFKLPETTESTIVVDHDQDIKQVIQKTWYWADADWWVDMTGELDGRVDHNGWEYGNNAWHHLTGMPTMQTFTRRRRWCRRARLVESKHQINDISTTAAASSQPKLTGGDLRKRS